MKISRALATLGAAVVFLQLQPPSDGRADSPALPTGAYEMTVRLELPHVERWAVNKTAKVCLTGAGENGAIPVPVLSANNPFAACAAKNLVSDGSTLQYDIVCPGRGAARAHATYSFAPGKFDGNIAMVMGAKNMTMTEIQHGRRVGECSASAARF